MIPFLVGLFALSGAAGLIYESIWSRYLGLFAGHSAYAQIVVLVIFMGGMALGALAAGRRSERVREPLLAYAAVEAAVGVLGLVFHPVYLAATGVALDVWFPALAGTPWLPVVKWGLAGLLILPQSVLLGATFPLMSAGVVRRSPGRPGRQLGLLYFSNSIGAAAGVLLSGFVLVGAVGLPGTIATAGAINLVVAAAVVVAVRGSRPGRTAPSPRAAAAARAPAATRGSPAPGPRGRRAPASPAPADSTPGRLLLAVAFGTATASFFYEIGWIRMLSLVMSSATHAFEVMLSAFILGLALGAWWIHGRADRLTRPRRTLGVIQWAMGLLALATLPLYLASFQWTAALVRSLSGAPHGYPLFTLARYGICLAIMLPATFCAGATLPLITRMLMGAGTGERAIGLVYGLNTLGSILGAAGAGLALMPVLGLKGTLIAGALLDIALGVALLASREPGRPRSLALAGTAAAVTLLAVAGAGLLRFDRALLISGVYRLGNIPARGSAEVLFYRDGRTATIGVWRAPDAGLVVLTSNGKPDASLTAPWFLPPEKRPYRLLRADETTQMLLALITLAHAPGARTAAVIGQGSGMTSHFLLGSPKLDELETIEIEPEVLRASRRFFPANRRVFEDRRSRFVVDDAKSHFAAARKRYDLIVSEPSNPWVSGVAGLFSTEFYSRLTRQLAPEGVFGQWLHLYEIDDDLVLSVISAIHRNFRSYELFMVGAEDMLIVATNRAAGLVPDWSVVRYPAIAEDLGQLPPFEPGVFEAMRITNREVLAPLVESGIQPNSDFHPILDLGAERARFARKVAAGFTHLYSDQFALSPMLLRRALAPPPVPLVPTPDIPRLRSLLVGSTLRLERLPALDPRTVDPRLASGLVRRAQLDSTLASGKPPADWGSWMALAFDAEEDLHLGTSGFADEVFFDRLRRYTATTGAPAGARQAIEFLHDLSAWNFAAAARGADTLVALSSAGEDWLPPDVMLQGVPAAKMLAGDRDGARRSLETLLLRWAPSAHDLRIRLLAAWVARDRGAR